MCRWKFWEDQYESYFNGSINKSYFLRSKNESFSYLFSKFRCSLCYVSQKKFVQISFNFYFFCCSLVNIRHFWHNVIGVAFKKDFPVLPWSQVHQVFSFPAIFAFNSVTGFKIIFSCHNEVSCKLYRSIFLSFNSVIVFWFYFGYQFLFVFIFFGFRFKFFYISIYQF